jgi:hypothetical protein
MATPQTFTMASPPSSTHGFGVDRRYAPITHCTPPQIRQISRWHTHYGASTTDSLSLHRPVLLAEPGPSGSTGPSRRCQGCFPPTSGVPERELPSASFRLLRQSDGAGLPPPRDDAAPRGARIRACTSSVLLPLLNLRRPATLVAPSVYETDGGPALLLCGVVVF